MSKGFCKYASQCEKTYSGDNTQLFSVTFIIDENSSKTKSFENLIITIMNPSQMLI